MGLAFTDDEIRYAILAARPEADFLDALNTMLLECGWIRLGDFNNGSEYGIVSPQGLTARCRFWSLAAGPGNWPRRFMMQMGSDASPGTVGWEHAFIAGVYSGDSNYTAATAFTQYSVWCNRCSVFIGAVHSDPKNSYQKAVQGGVPFASGAVLSTPCGGEMPPPAVATAELWFSAGDDSGNPSIFSTASAYWSFRNQYVCQRYSLCHNGAITSANFHSPPNPPPETMMGWRNEPYALQLGIMRTARAWIRAAGSLAQKFEGGFIYPDGSPVVLNPLLYHNGRVIGEIYDAALISKPMALDQVESISASGVLTTWQNYMTATGPTPGYFYDDLSYVNEAAAAAFLLLRAREADTDEGNVAY